MIQEIRDHRYRGLVVVGGAAVNKDPVSRVQALDADLTARNGRHLVRLLRANVRPRGLR